MKKGKITFPGWFWLGCMPIILGYFFLREKNYFGLIAIAVGLYFNYITLRLVIHSLNNPTGKTGSKRLAFTDEELGVAPPKKKWPWSSDEYKYQTLEGEETEMNHHQWDENNNNLHFDGVIGRDPNDNRHRFGKGPQDLYVDYESNKNEQKGKWNSKDDSRKR